ncbi:TRAP transporter small permease subunit [Kiloniella laminariae]|uniref:TRAP transporter small permease subunit n=1 Tax=Kiloniella laminariae TaxID=454162 RepID=UPI0003813AF6|nr:TRAP transporter small permease subunit [Kiloniella laminariae]
MASFLSLARAIDILNDKVGRTVSWLALFMVLVQFIVVLLRYVFGYGSIFMQESIIYMHGFLFMLGSGYTLLHGGHVRVDIFYGDASEKKQAIVDFFGAIFLLLPVLALIFIYSWPYVEQSWAIKEASKETSGIPYLYVLKSVIIAFCALMALQGISMAIHSLAIICGCEHKAKEDGPGGI